MLKLVTEQYLFEDCVNKMSSYFTETWDISLEELKEENYKVFTIIQNDKPIYYSIRHFNQTKSNTEVDFYFSLLDESFRGKGIGTQAMIECIDWFKKEYKNCVFNASCRYSNLSSLMVFLKSGFKIIDNNITGSEKGAVLQIDDKSVDFINCNSDLLGHCGVSALTMIYNYKNIETKTFEQIKNLVTVVPMKGIPQQSMLINVMSLFPECVNDIKVIHNLTNENDWCLHKIKQQLSKVNGIALMNIMTEDGYPHWIVAYDYNPKTNQYFVYDSENKINIISELNLLRYSIQRNIFSILF